MTNNFEYQYHVEQINRWTYKVTVYQGEKFIGKAITNDVQEAVKKIVNDYESK